MNKLKVALISLFSFALASAASAEYRIGVSAQYHMFETTGTETLRQSSNTTRTSVDEKVVVPSLFLEVVSDAGLGIGVDYVPVAELGSGTGDDDDAETSGANTASAELASHITYYAIIQGEQGLYAKLGMAFADVDTTENLATGDAYPNTTTEGPMIALGYSMDQGNYFVRGEVSHIAYDDVSITSTGGSKVDASLETTAVTISVGKAF